MNSIEESRQTVADFLMKRTKLLSISSLPVLPSPLRYATLLLPLLLPQIRHSARTKTFQIIVISIFDRGTSKMCIRCGRKGHTIWSDKLICITADPLWMKSISPSRTPLTLLDSAVRADLLPSRSSITTPAENQIMLLSSADYRTGSQPSSWFPVCAMIQAHHHESQVLPRA